MNQTGNPPGRTTQARRHTQADYLVDAQFKAKYSP